MSLIIQSKFWHKSNNIVIDYSDKSFIKQRKEINTSGTLYRKGDKLAFKLVGALNTTDNSNENTNYMNDGRLIKLVDIEKKDGNNYTIDCGDWSKDLVELIEQSATYFLYKGSTIENFMKDKHRYHILSQGDIVKIGKIYLKVLHIKLIKPEQKILKTSSNKDEDNNNIKDISGSNSIGNENAEGKDDKKNKSVVKNDLIIENEINNEKTPKKNLNNTFIKKYLTEAHPMTLWKISNNKNINRSMIMSQKLNLTQKTIDINEINEAENITNIKQIRKKKISRNKNEKKKKKVKSKIITKKIISKEEEEKKIKNKICRICLSEETSPNKNPLICPCICKGSMKYIHYLCLKNWLNLKVESELGPIHNIETERPTITYSTNEICCELCKTKLPDYVKHNGKLYNVSFYKPKYDQFLVLESVRNDSRKTRFIHIIPLSNYSMHRIGRLNNCDLSLPDSSISRVHCCFYIENNQLVLENNSKFGTKVLIQNQKINLIPDYPLCIETQNTYIKLFVEKKFNLFDCCGDSTKSFVRMHPYQNQNQKGFDLFCSMVFKDEDENDSDNEDEKEDNPETNINIVDNNNKNENMAENIKLESESKKEDNNSKLIKEQEKKGKKKDYKKKDIAIETGDNNKTTNIKKNDGDIDDKNEDKITGLKNKEINLINININDDNDSDEETKLKNMMKGINIINQNLNENKDLTKEKLIKDEIKSEEKKSNHNHKDKLIKDNKQNDNFKERNSRNYNNKKMEILISPEKNKINEDLIKSEIKKELNNKKINANLIDSYKNLIKINNNETENPQEHLIQLESEEKNENEKKSIINFFNNNDDKTLKYSLNNINRNNKEIESNKNNEMNESKSNKCINLDQINNLSYRRGYDKIDNNHSVADNYGSIFGLIPNEKNESSLLFAPKHKKNIKFDNYDVHFESEKINNQKSGNKIWDKFNWSFK